MGMNPKYTESESSQRGTKITQQFGRDRSDGGVDNLSEARNGRAMKGGVDNISPMISGGKVPRE